MGETAERLWGVTEAKGYLGVSTWTMYQLAKTGKVRSVRVGRLLRFREAWLRAYAEANATGPEVNDGEGVWSGDSLRAPRREVGGDVGTPASQWPAPKGNANRGHRSGGMEANAGGAASRGTYELQVAAADRKRRIVPKRVAS